MNKKVEKLEEKKKHLLRLKKLADSNCLYQPYKSSQLERNILRWYEFHPVTKIAEKLKINKSYVYAVIEKYKKIYTKEELQQEGV